MAWMPILFTEEKEPKWIPCSERLPENDCRVLICGQRGGIDIGRFSHGGRFWVRTHIVNAVA